MIIPRDHKYFMKHCITRLGITQQGIMLQQNYTCFAFGSGCKYAAFCMFAKSKINKLGIDINITNFKKLKLIVKIEGKEKWDRYDLQEQ